MVSGLEAILSRLLYATPESGTPYYKVHLNVLKAKGIITDINPNLIELRSNLMLMLIRAGE